MNDFLYYLLKVSGIFITLYLFYRLFFSRLTFHLFNRLFLLAIIPLSLLLPLWTINYEFASPGLLEEEMIANIILSEIVATPTIDVSVWDWMQIVGWGYALGVLAYFWGLTASVLRLLRLKQRSIACREGQFIIISASVPSAFSCFKRIFIPQSKIKDCDTSILEHEKLHGKAWHSLDLLVTELFLALLWFNPFVYLFRKTLRSVHEFQIDSMLLRKKNIAIADYLQLIAENLFVNQKMSVVSNYFNRITIKKRIVMITKTKTSKLQIVRYLLIVPVIALFSVSFSAKADDKPTEEKTVSTKDRLPTYPGGMAELSKYLAKNIVYPESAKKNGIEGVVYLSITVKHNGELDKVKVVRSAKNSEMDEEAVRVVRGMPKWNPGKGKSMQAQYNIPVQFRIPKEDK